MSRTDIHKPSSIIPAEKEKKMVIGQKFILVNIPPWNYFTGHNTKDEPKFIEIEISEIKENVPGEFSGKIQGNGYIAKGSDGYNYAYNYPTYSEGFGGTSWVRYMKDDEFKQLDRKTKDELIKDYMWHDVVNYQCPALPKFVNDFSIEIKFCEEHQKLYYIYNSCFYCALKFTPDNRVIMNMKEHKWLGWY